MTKYKIFIMPLLSISLFLSGCCQRPSSPGGQEIVVSINNYNITRDEFDREYRDSAYGNTGTDESRKSFLESLIDRKLILQYAQREGLDREKGFLRMIEKFWEQSLLKVALDKKMKEAGPGISQAGWKEKRAEESKMLNDWIVKLRAKARIKIKEDVLKGKDL
jgi:hypothetical protein